MQRLSYEEIKRVFGADSRVRSAAPPDEVGDAPASDLALIYGDEAWPEGRE
jgi:hypothetical protein